MNAKRIQDAEKLVKKGEEHLKTSMFKWTPDVDSAIECFDKGFQKVKTQFWAYFSNNPVSKCIGSQIGDKSFAARGENERE